MRARLKLNASGTKGSPQRAFEKREAGAAATNGKPWRQKELRGPTPALQVEKNQTSTAAEKGRGVEKKLPTRTALAVLGGGGGGDLS